MPFGIAAVARMPLRIAAVARQLSMLPGIAPSLGITAVSGGGFSRHSGAVTLEKGSQTSFPQGSEAPEGRAKWLNSLRKSLQHLGVPIESHGHGISSQRNSADGGCSALKRLLANRGRCAAAVSDDVWRAERGPWTACVSSIASSRCNGKVSLPLLQASSNARCR